MASRPVSGARSPAALLAAPSESPTPSEGVATARCRRSTRERHATRKLAAYSTAVIPYIVENEFFKQQCIIFTSETFGIFVILKIPQ